MATHWLREITTTTTGTGTGFPFAAKCLALFLQNILGFGSLTQGFGTGVSGTGDSVGAPDGANKQLLTDAAGEFNLGDVGKTITMSGMVDPLNDGAFTITDWVSLNQVRYVNAAGSAETSVFSWVITDLSNWVTTEKGGSNGSINISGTDFIFEDTTAAAFVGGDTGKWVVIADPTNPRNSGIYKATFSTANRVTIDFRSGGAEYPTQNLGANLVWSMLSDSYLVPTRNGDYFRLRTPHANGWEIEVKIDDPKTGALSYDKGVVVRVATDANWSGSKILSEVYTGVDNTDVVWSYCAGDDAGEFINFFFHNSTNNEYGGFVAANLDLTELDRLPAEQAVLMGNRDGVTAWTANTYTRDHSDTKLARGDLWSDKEQHPAKCYMIEASYADESLGFSGWISRTVNVRNSNQWDFIDGVPVVIDPNFELYSQNEFEMAGKVKGVVLTSGAATVRTALNDAGTLDKFHIQDGLAIEWPNVTQQH